MKPVTDHQKLEAAKVLLKEANVIWMVWEADDIKSMIEDKLTQVGLSFPVNEVLMLISLTHLSCDDDEDSIWFAIEDAINTLAENNLGR